MPTSAKIVLKLVYLIILPTALIWAVRTYGTTETPKVLKRHQAPVPQFKEVVEPGPIIFSTQFADISFTGPNRILAVDYDGKLVSFFDGKKSEGRFSDQKVVNAPNLSFINSSTGWAFVPGENKAALLKTIDSGKTWKLVNNDFGNAEIRHLKFVNEQVGWIQDGIGNLWRTEDGGKEWDRTFTGLYTVEPVQNVVIIDAWNAVVADVVGIHVTSDGGANWNLCKEQNDIRLVAAIDRTKLWALSEGREVFRSNDAGRTWTTLTRLDSEARMVALQFINSRDGWMVGTERVDSAFRNKQFRGVALQTRDGGTNWFPASAPRDFGFARIGFSGEQSGWLLGNEGFYETKDGGRTWLTLAPESNPAASTVIGSGF